MSRSRSVLVALCLAVFATPCQALTFHFSFNNAVANDPLQSLVEGVISGLSDNNTGPAASVLVTSNPAGFGEGEYVGNPTNNTFTVSGGAITALDFRSFGGLNTAPDVTCCSMIIAFEAVGLAEDNNIVNGQGSNLIFTPVSEVPLPAALPLFATGLGVMGLLGWRRKRTRAVAG